jgi:hypothetical protein
MVRETWYRHLAIADRLIVEARDCIDSQKHHLSALKHDGEDTSRPPRVGTYSRRRYI